MPGLEDWRQVRLRYTAGGQLAHQLTEYDDGTGSGIFRDAGDADWSRYTVTQHALAFGAGGQMMMRHDAADAEPWRAGARIDLADGMLGCAALITGDRRLRENLGSTDWQDVLDAAGAVVHRPVDPGNGTMLNHRRRSGRHA